MEIVLWLGCGVTAIVASVLAARSRRARLVGRVAVGTLMLAGGAAVNAAYLWSGLRDYAAFADPAHFSWVTDLWRSVVAPNQVLFINLLILFEAAAGVLVLTGGRRTQVGLLATIGFHLLLWLFGWIETVYVLVMLPALVLLLRAELRATAQVSGGHTSPTPSPAARS